MKKAGKPVKAPEQSDVAEQCRCTARLAYMVNKQYVQQGLERVLSRKKRETPPVPAKATGEAEAKIIAASCSEPPEGYSRRALRLLEERGEAIAGIELSRAAIGGALKKRASAGGEGGAGDGQSERPHNKLVI